MISEASTEKKNQKNDYFIAAGSIVFKMKDEDTLFTTQANSLITNNKGNFSLSTIGRIQQSLQANFMNTLPEDMAAKVEIINCTILSINYLGNMTKEDFYDVKLPQTSEVNKETK